MPFTNKDGYLTKAFQKEKHDTASKLLKVLRTETGVVVNKITFANCAAPPTASAGQYVTSNCKRLLFRFPPKTRYINVRTFNLNL